MADQDHRADTAGKEPVPEESKKEKALLVQSAVPALVPEIKKSETTSPEQKTEAVPGKISSPPQSPILGNIDELIRTAQASALGKNVIKKPEASKTQASETSLPPEPPPLERSVREIGLAQQPLRPATPPEAPTVPKMEVPKGVNPRIRTYATDMSEEIKKRRTTLSSIVGAEQNRNLELGIPTEQEPPENKNRLVIFAGATLLLIVLGGAALSAAFLFKKPNTIEIPHTALIPTNHFERIETIPNEPLGKTLGVAKKAVTLELGEVEELIVRTNNSTPSATELLKLLGAPDVLARNATNVMIGVHSFDHNQPFILITVSTYDLAFDAMLLWEARMNEGLGDFFKPSSLAPTGIVSSPPRLTFTDSVLQNIDVRESQPSWHIMYAFLRPNLILITTNESTFREVMTRLSLQKG